jgi:phage recombination protein Bet
MTNVSAFPARDHSPPTPPPIPDIPSRTILDYLAAFDLASQLTEPEKTQFISVCQAFKLNPFKREVHLAVYGEGSYRKVSIITGYETYLKRAERTGRLNGWSSRVEGEGDHMRAIVEIHRKDWQEPFQHEVYWPEAVQRTKAGAPTSFWARMPKFQLKKVCISQAFRLAFPDELGGLPYDASELPDAESVLTVATATAPLPRQAHDSPTPEPESPSSSSQDEAPATPVASSPEPEPAGIPSPITEPSRYPHRDRFLGEPPEALLARLESFLDDNYSCFTPRHRDWVFEKAKHSRDREGIVKMISYAEKCVRNTGSQASA